MTATKVEFENGSIIEALESNGDVGRSRIKILEYTSPLCPSTNGYNEYRVVKAGTRSFVDAYPSKEYKQYKKDFIPYLKELVKKYEWEMLTESKHYYLDITIYFERTNCDPTNYFKCLQDVCNNILFFDDKIILGRVNRVYYTYKPDCEPRIECTLKPVDYIDIGLFNDKDEYEKFIDNCKMCRTYRDGLCKTLEEYMSYKITKDFNVTSRSCNKFKATKEIKVVNKKC